MKSINSVKYLLELLIVNFQLSIADYQILPSLVGQFRSPSGKYRSWTWRRRMGINFSKEGITKDLNAMRDAGIGGATILALIFCILHF
ncbi:MAG: hypothetical protein LBT50_10975 [Prevotellaceae bacterium]|jgi:hypothetical protein|nr:hypothetical protein [Prevotellaceae bacterium]